MKVALLADYSVFPYLFKNFTYSFVKRCAYSHYMNLGEKNNFPTDKIKFLWFSTNLVPGFFKQEADIWYLHTFNICEMIENQEC